MTTDTIGDATYSPDDNKLRIYPFARLDKETYAKVKEAGFRWAPKQELFVAPMWTPAREDLLLELCGEIGDEDTSLVERAEQRAERFEEYSEHRAQDAEHAHKAVSAIADNIPLGQPILVGHHSEKRARRDADKIDRGMRRAVKMWDQSKYWKGRAAGAIRHAKYKELPGVRQRRIKKLEAEKRKAEKTVAESQQRLKQWGGFPDHELAVRIANYDWVNTPADERHPSGASLWSRLNDERDPWTAEQAAEWAMKVHTRRVIGQQRWIAHYENRLLYERALLDEQGGAAAENFANLKPGGRVLVSDEWLPVVRVNRSQGAIVSVTTAAPRHVTWSSTWKYGIEQVKDYREPDEREAAAVKQALKKPPIKNYPGPDFHHMTKRDWARTHADYKTTKTVDGTHRVRFCLHHGKWSFVYLTDQKRTDPPATPAVEGAKGLEGRRGYEPDQGPQVDLPREVELSERQPRRVEPVEETKFDKLRDTLENGGVQAVSAPQLFVTPPELARRMVELAELRMPHHVLEPSAGMGALTFEIHRAQVARLVAVEINLNLVDSLRAAVAFGPRTSNRVIGGDFLAMNGNLGPFDRVLMNPPFANGQDISHVRHAFGHLKPGGILVAVMSAGSFFRSDRKAREFQGWADDLSAEVIDLPPDTFKESGTSVNTKLVRIHKRL